MGMYTEFILNIDLRADTPNQVIETLEYMIKDHSNDYTFTLPDHPLFKKYISPYDKDKKPQSTRWYYMLTCGSAYFQGIPASRIRTDAITRRCEVSIFCNLKNYNSEIELFLDWIFPYVHQTYLRFCGYIRYEEDEAPSLLFITPEGFLRIWNNVDIETAYREGPNLHNIDMYGPNYPKRCVHGKTILDCPICKPID